MAKDAIIYPIQLEKIYSMTYIDNMFKRTPKETYPVLPLRNVVVFPGTVHQLNVGREKSIKALEVALESGARKVFVVTQLSASDDEPEANKLYQTGVICSVMHLMKVPEGIVKVVIEGEKRAKIKNYSVFKDYSEVEIELLPDTKPAGDIDALARTVVKQFGEYLKVNRRIPFSTLETVNKIVDPVELSDKLASYLPVKIFEHQKLLDELNPQKRLEEIAALIEREISILNTELKIRGRVKNQIEKNQKDYYLNEQLKAIQKELEDEEGKDDVSELEKKINELALSPEAKEKALSELKKLRSMSPISAEASVIRNYLDWITALPWKNPTDVKTDINEAEQVLQKDHYGLAQVKERILEYLAVQSRTGGKVRGPILCLVGPPGVGKTSLGRSIAEATGREFAKIALGGMRDEAEIRGHRRTYLGSMPGKIIQSMKKTKHSNPLILLDEIDKMSQDFRGDPASALLEVLDPEQNNKFNDHYLEVDYDLSDVMFIATANSLRLPRPLLDRMEIIRISGYTEDEKIEIAKTHLIPKLLESHAMQENEWKISDDALTDLVRYYTREAGVRSLERELANLIRKALKKIQSGKAEKVAVTRKNLEKYAKVRKYSYGQTEKNDQIGVTTGLAYTETGGDILQIEAVKMPGGKGKISYTGNLEKVMRESIEAAGSAIRARLLDFGVTPPQFMEYDIHVHVPEGATPKDGPSAGVAMTTSIVSVITGIPVKRTVAMTGEIRLTGQVLPIGGLKEKLLAALRSGIKTVLIPIENVKDLAEIPDNVKSKLEIIPVSTVDEVLKHALVRMPEPTEWDGELKSKKKSPDDEARLAH